MTPEEHRRRIDTVLDRAFLASLADLPADELRSRLRDVRAEEDAISYVRRNLHGRLDLLRSELGRRRGGEDTVRTVAALVAALGERTGPARGVRAGLGLRAAAVAGRRRAEKILSEDHLARLPELEEAEVERIVDSVSEAEGVLSQQRHRLHEVIDVLESELAGRYKAGLEPSLERLR